jgi:hypothetical protein
MAAEREDRILPVTRGLAALIIPFLAAAVVILYFMPDRTDQLFAWQVMPRMSAMMLGATYLLGVFFFTTVLLGRRWTQVRAGFLPVTAFAALMGVSTLLHYDRFNHEHIAFWIWLVLYLTTPFLVPLVWFLNQRAAHNARVPDTPRMAEPVRWFITLLGVSALVVTVVAFTQPQILIDMWPWTLSPLTARILGGEFALFGAIGVILALDPRWHSIRQFLRWQLASPAFFLVAVYFSRESFDWDDPLAWVFVVNLTVLFVLGLPALYFWMESRARAVERGAASTE